MITTTEFLPITESIQASDESEVSTVVKDAAKSNSAVYTIGGGTSLDYGLPAKREGVGLDVTQLSNVIDYPARDMTITVQAGITMATLAETLAAERQRLPIDVPHSNQATLGGVIATNFSGARRFGLGTMRDYVIGVGAIDGLGVSFRSGGRVVKNVAGYDFCKLLTGSLGTLAVITEVTLKVKPIPAAHGFVVAAVRGLQHADQLLDQLATTSSAPVSIELLAGPHWSEHSIIGSVLSESIPESETYCLVVGLEGTEQELAWMIEQVQSEWKLHNINTMVVRYEQAEQLWFDLAEFPAAGDASLVLKASVVPSYTTQVASTARALAPDCSVQAHAGNGIVVLRFPEIPDGGVSRLIMTGLLPVTGGGQGNVVMLSNAASVEMTPQSVWGGIDAPFWLMQDVKRQFDPRNVLNPGRFVYS